jgi:hypothetical protein
LHEQQQNICWSQPLFATIARDGSTTSDRHLAYQDATSNPYNDNNNGPANSDTRWHANHNPIALIDCSIYFSNATWANRYA